MAFRDVGERVCGFGLAMRDAPDAKVAKRPAFTQSRISQCPSPPRSLYTSTSTIIAAVIEATSRPYSAAEYARHVGASAQRSRCALRSVIRPEGRGRSGLLSASSDGFVHWLAIVWCKRCSQTQAVVRRRRRSSVRTRRGRGREEGKRREREIVWVVASAKTTWMPVSGW